jgi:hypothetical protein
MFEPAKIPPPDGAAFWPIVTALALGFAMTRSYAAHDQATLVTESLALGLVVLTLIVPRRLDYDVQDDWLVIRRTIGLQTRRFPVREATVTTVTPVWGQRLRGGFGRRGWPTDPESPRARDGVYRVDGKPAEVVASTNGPGLLIDAPTLRVFVTPADLDGMRAALEQAGATVAGISTPDLTGSVSVGRSRVATGRVRRGQPRRVPHRRTGPERIWSRSAKARPTGVLQPRVQRHGAAVRDGRAHRQDWRSNGP